MYKEVACEAPRDDEARHFFAAILSVDDVAGSLGHQGVLDQGTLLRVFDPTVVMPLRLKEFLLSTAEDNHIPYQYFVSKGGTVMQQLHKAN